MRTAILVTLALMVPAVAFAQSGAEPAATSFEFRDAEEVRGAPTSPVGEVLTVPSGGTRHTLIKIRTQFVQEIARSADAL